MPYNRQKCQAFKIQVKITNGVVPFVDIPPTFTWCLGLSFIMQGLPFLQKHKRPWLSSSNVKISYATNAV